jgi:hypothetical protein
MVKLRSVPQPDVAVIFAYRPVPSSSFKTTIKDVAAELKLDWHTVKALDQQYMEAQLKRAGTPSPQVIGIQRKRIGRVHE